MLHMTRKMWHVFLLAIKMTDAQDLKWGANVRNIPFSSLDFYFIKHLLQYEMTRFELTLKVAFGSEVANGQSEYREFIQLRNDALLKRQETSKMVQLCVEALTMPLTGIAFRRILYRGLGAAKQK